MQILIKDMLLKNAWTGAVVSSIKRHCVHICIFLHSKCIVIQFRWSFCISRVQFIVLGTGMPDDWYVDAVPNAAILDPTCRNPVPLTWPHLSAKWTPYHQSTTQQSPTVRFISVGRVQNPCYPSPLPFPAFASFLGSSAAGNDARRAGRAAVTFWWAHSLALLNPRTTCSRACVRGALLERGAGSGLAWGFRKRPFPRRRALDSSSLGRGSR
jgi:hypothetical protein